MKSYKKFAKSISFYIKNLISKNKIYDIEFQCPVHIRKIYENGVFYAAAPIKGDKIKNSIYPSIFDYKKLDKNIVINYDSCIQKDSSEVIQHITIPAMSKFRVSNIIDNKIAVVCVENNYYEFFYAYVPIESIGMVLEDFSCSRLMEWNSFRFCIYGPHGYAEWCCPQKFYCFRSDIYKGIIIPMYVLFFGCKTVYINAFIFGILDTLEQLKTSLYMINEIINEDSDSHIECYSKISKMFSKTSEFLKTVVNTASSMDGFKRYYGYDVGELFQKKILSEKELKERKEGNISHITDNFLQKIQSRQDLLQQFNKIT